LTAAEPFPYVAVPLVDPVFPFGPVAVPVYDADPSPYVTLPDPDALFPFGPVAVAVPDASPSR